MQEKEKERARLCCMWVCIFLGSATLSKAGKLDFGKIFKRIAVIFVRLL